MKFIIFLTIGIGCLATSKAGDPYDVGYRLALGPLEFSVKLGKEVANCYKENKDAYEDSILEFSKNITKIRNNVNKALGGNSNSKNFIMWALNEMKYIADSLNSFFLDFKGKIFNWKFIEGGKAIWRERYKIENHCKQYERHKRDLENRKESHHSSYFPQMDRAFDKILEESDKLVKNVMQCCEGKVSLTEQKA